MKKSFTLLATVVLLSSAAFAQYGGNHQGNNGNGNNGYGNNGNSNGNNGYGNNGYGNNTPDPRDVVVYDNRRGNNGGGYYFSERDKDIQIAQINRNYYGRMESVRNRFFMPRFKKERIIAELQFQRDQEVRSVYDRFNSRNNAGNQRGYQFNNHDRDHDHDHDRRNW